MPVSNKKHWRLLIDNDMNKTDLRKATGIGIVLCRARKGLIAEHALADLKKPIGVSTYQLGLTTPNQLQAKLQKDLTAPRKAKKNGL